MSPLSKFPLSKSPPWSSLSDSILTTIFLCFTTSELYPATQVCQSWTRVIYTTPSIIGPIWFDLQEREGTLSKQTPTLELVRHFYALYSRHDHLGKNAIVDRYDISAISSTWSGLGSSMPRFLLHAGLLALTSNSPATCILIFDIAQHPIRLIFRIPLDRESLITYSLNTSYLAILKSHHISIVRLMGRFTAHPWTETTATLPLPSGSSPPVSIALTAQTDELDLPLVALICHKELHIINPAIYKPFSSSPPSSSASSSSTSFSEMLPEGLVTFPLPRVLQNHTTNIPPARPPVFGHTATSVSYSTHILGSTEPSYVPPPRLGVIFDNFIDISEDGRRMELFPARRQIFGEIVKYLHPLHLFEDYWIVTTVREHDVRIIALYGKVRIERDGHGNAVLKFRERVSVRMILFSLPRERIKVVPGQGKARRELPVLYHIHRGNSAKTGYLAFTPDTERVFLIPLASIPYHRPHDALDIPPAAAGAALIRHEAKEVVIRTVGEEVMGVWASKRVATVVGDEGVVVVRVWAAMEDERSVEKWRNVGVHPGVVGESVERGMGKGKRKGMMGREWKVGVDGMVGRKGWGR